MTSRCMNGSKENRFSPPSVATGAIDSILRNPSLTGLNLSLTRFRRSDTPTSSCSVASLRVLRNSSRVSSLNTNTNGELRAFVVTGEMEKVFPYDIYPMSLIKAVIINDIDAMEKLGIYEVDSEDFALCEFINTSKIDIQQIVRDGMENMREELY